MTASASFLWTRLADPLGELGMDLEDVTVQRAGRREVVRVVVDRDGGVDLDGIAEASRVISALLDAEPVAAQFAGAYVLEVTSPGVDRPLTQPRHWRRAVGRLVQAGLADGSVLLGRVASAGQDHALLREQDGSQSQVNYADVVRATVQVEFARPDDGQSDMDQSDVDQSDVDQSDVDQSDMDRPD